MIADLKTEYWYDYEEQTFETPDGERCLGFSIVAYCGGRPVYRAENAFLSQSVAKDFVDRCNFEKLELCHLADVLEDRLCVLPL